MEISEYVIDFINSFFDKHQVCYACYGPAFSSGDFKNGMVDVINIDMISAIGHNNLNRTSRLIILPAEEKAKNTGIHKSEYDFSGPAISVASILLRPITKEELVARLMMIRDKKIGIEGINYSITAGVSVDRLKSAKCLYIDISSTSEIDASGISIADIIDIVKNRMQLSVVGLSEKSIKDLRDNDIKAESSYDKYHTYTDNPKWILSYSKGYKSRMKRSDVYRKRPYDSQNRIKHMVVVNLSNMLHRKLSGKIGGYILQYNSGNTKNSQMDWVMHYLRACSSIELFGYRRTKEWKVVVENIDLFLSSKTENKYIRGELESIKKNFINKPSKEE